VDVPAQEGYKVLSFKVKIEGLILFVVTSNDLVEGIILRERTYYRMKIQGLILVGCD
jgi:hypothetical protein